MTVVGLVPGMAYFVIVLLGLLFGIVAPVRWLWEQLSMSDWSVAIYLAVAMGSPALAAVGSLILGLGRRSGLSLGRVCGWIAWFLLVLNGVFVLFQVPFMLIAD